MIGHFKHTVDLGIDNFRAFLAAQKQPLLCEAGGVNQRWLQIPEQAALGLLSHSGPHVSQHDFNV